MKRIFFFLAIATVLVCAIASCEDDSTTIVPGGSSVKGTVTFLNSGSWPSTGDVQVSIYATLPGNFIPNGPPDDFTDPITPGVGVYSYEFVGLDAGTYAAIYVSWRDPANPSGATLLGMYWTYIDSLGVAQSGPYVVPKAPGPKSVTISSSNLNVNDLDIVADINLVP